jgi:hypothetical protein
VSTRLSRQQIGLAGIATLARRRQIVDVIGPAFRYRNDVIYHKFNLLRRRAAISTLKTIALKHEEPLPRRNIPTPTLAFLAFLRLALNIFGYRSPSDHPIRPHQIPRIEDRSYRHFSSWRHIPFHFSL